VLTAFKIIDTARAMFLSSDNDWDVKLIDIDRGSINAIKIIKGAVINNRLRMYPGGTRLIMVRIAITRKYQRKCPEIIPGSEIIMRLADMKPSHFALASRL